MLGTQASAACNLWLTLQSDLLQLLEKVMMAKDRNKPVICKHTKTRTHTNTHIKMHANERLNIAPRKRKEQTKDNKKNLRGGEGGIKHRYMLVPFTFSQDSAVCFSGSSELIALKFTAFKARAQLIIWPTETLPMNYSSKKDWTFCWPKNSTKTR